MSSDKDKIIADLMKPLRDRYLNELAEHHVALQKYCASKNNKKLTEEECDDIRNTVHRYVGSGVIFGFPAITEIGSKLEERIINHSDGDDKAIIKCLEKFLSACEDALALKKKK